jgi:Ca-activated chloride channel family protein
MGIFLVWSFKAKQALLRKFAEKGLLSEIADSLDRKRQIIKALFLVLVLTFSLLALMRPQWGFKWQEISRKSLDILIAIDTSKSMLAIDVKPNRLERSKLAVKDLLKKLKGDRVGLIAFSGTAFLQCPLTSDYNGFMLALDDLDVTSIPRGGTSISSVIKTAMDSYEGGQEKYKALILITDGEDHTGDPVKAAKEAAKENIRIFCIGIGTLEGDLIQIADSSGKKTFLKHRNGNIVKTRLNEAVLKQIAVATNGMYVRSSGADFGLDIIYDKKLANMERRDMKARMDKVYYERFQIPLAIALIFLLIEMIITNKKTKKTR